MKPSITQILSPKCKEMKCILYPTCRNKRTVQCKDLSMHYTFHFNIYSKYTASHIWKYINKVLPKLWAIEEIAINDVIYPVIVHPIKAYTNDTDI